MLRSRPEALVRSPATVPARFAKINKSLPLN